MPAPTPKQRRAAKQRDSLGWVRNAKKAEKVERRPFVGEHVYSVSTQKLGTVKEIYTDNDGLTRARVQHFNGEWWDCNPPLALLEII